MNPEFQLKYEVMSRIKTVRNIWLFSTSPLAGVIFTAALIFCSSILVSFGDVVANMMMQVDWTNRLTYAYSSLLHSRVTVQALAILLAGSFLMVSINSLRRLRAIIWA
ncbi:MAG: hypothetical protein Q8Q03_02235 [bacterium]|nr:hypothetical protein [bacterium]